MIILLFFPAYCYVDLELRDVVAIRRLPSDRPGEKPIIVRLFNSDAKRNVMHAKKNLKNQ
jgi:hypothetical protein